MCKFAALAFLFNSKININAYAHHLNFRKIIAFVFSSFCCCLKFPVNAVHLLNLERQSKSFSTGAIKGEDIVIR